MKAMPAEQRGCMKMSETVLEDQGVDLHVFQENTNHQNMYKTQTKEDQCIDLYVLQEKHQYQYTKHKQNEIND